MKISATPINSSQPVRQAPTLSTKSDSAVDNIVDKTYLSANYAASGLSGALSGAGAWVTTSLPQTASTTVSLTKNLIKTEKYGSTLKLLAIPTSVAATIAGTVLAAPLSLLNGALVGVGAVESSNPRQFTVGDAAKRAYNSTSEKYKKHHQHKLKNLDDLGNHKLELGEKPIDIPLIKTGKTLVMAAIGTAIGGVTGVVTALTSTATEAVKGVAQSLGDGELNVPQKLYSSAASLVSAPLHGVGYGLRTGLGIAGNAISKTWSNDSISDGARSIYNNVKVGVAATVAPTQTLTEVRDSSPLAENG